MTANIFLNSIAIGGYRSFGSIQYFEKFSKVNLIIGQNNVGKSNVFKFISKVYPSLAQPNKSLVESMDRHFPNNKSFKFGLGLNKGILESHIHQRIKKDKDDGTTSLIIKALVNQISPDNQEIWYYFDERAQSINDDSFLDAFSKLSNEHLQKLWVCLTDYSGGGDRNNWIGGILPHLYTRPSIQKVEIIPAIREVNSKGINRGQFSGERLIDELAQLQNPSSLEQSVKEKFERINKFLQEVTTNASARIEIPYQRDTINVYMNNRVLPLEALGSGIQEIIIIAAAATTIDNCIVCVEEPELHLNPILQKRLVRYLEKHTSNQYFISTHSASLMDTPGAEIYHIRLVDDESIVERVTSDKKRTEVCADLGYHPSDLLQSNCVIWVEGPSDRVYLNYWIKAFDSNLLEGVHYSIMFYGGKLLSHLTADHEVTVSEFISLRRLNRHAAILIDSDKAKKGVQINATKRRIITEFEKEPGFAWVTQGREIENYLSINELKAAILGVHPNATLLSSFGQYDNNLKIMSQKSESIQASKVEVAKKYTEDNPVINSDGILDIYDLKSKVKQLVDFVRSSNKNA